VESAAFFCSFSSSWRCLRRSLMDIFEVLTSADTSAAAAAARGGGAVAEEIVLVLTELAILIAGSATTGAVGLAVAAAGTTGGLTAFWGLMLPTVR